MCCLNTLPPLVTIAAADNNKKQMEKGNLLFVTKENEERLRLRKDLKSYFIEFDKLNAKLDEGTHGKETQAAE